MHLSNSHSIQEMCGHFVNLTMPRSRLTPQNLIFSRCLEPSHQVDLHCNYNTNQGPLQCYSGNRRKIILMIMSLSIQEAVQTGTNSLFRSLRNLSAIWWTLQCSALYQCGCYNFTTRCYDDDADAITCATRCYDDDADAITCPTRCWCWCWCWC